MFALIAVFILVIVLTAKIIGPNIKYNKAVSMIESGNVLEAYDILTSLNGYKDSEEKIASIHDEYKMEKLERASVGDYVLFGKYEQDNNTSNGKEDIEWLVAATNDRKILLISRYALDCKPYNEKYTSITWETCTLRKWLNQDFLNNAFSAKEKAAIPLTKVPAYRNPDYSTDAGNTTQDKVFLLSIMEAEKYFSSNDERKCMPTAYAEERGVSTKNVDGKNYCWWWLRTSGGYQSYVAGVMTGGGIAKKGSSDEYPSAIRPAIWIDLSALDTVGN